MVLTRPGIFLEIKIAKIVNRVILAIFIKENYYRMLKSEVKTRWFFD